MSNKKTDLSQLDLKGLFINLGLTPELSEKAVIDFERYKEAELRTYISLLPNEISAIAYVGSLVKKRKLKDSADLIDKIVNSYIGYINYKSQIAETYQKTKDWAIVYYTNIYMDVKETQESFIDYIEEVYQTKIKDLKHLQELTGIYELDYWDEKLKEYREIEKDKAKETAIRELDETLTNARFSKYSRALGRALDEGAKYKDLIQIQPKDYGLPESWKYCLASDQYTTILWAISLDYFLREPGFIVLAPKPRDIAEDLEAPLSVVMDIIKDSCKWRV